MVACAAAKNEKKKSAIRHRSLQSACESTPTVNVRLNALLVVTPCSLDVRRSKSMGLLDQVFPSWLAMRLPKQLTSLIGSLEVRAAELDGTSVVRGDRLDIWRNPRLYILPRCCVVWLQCGFALG